MDPRPFTADDETFFACVFLPAMSLLFALQSRRDARRKGYDPHLGAVVGALLGPLGIWFYARRPYASPAAAAADAERVAREGEDDELDEVL